MRSRESILESIRVNKPEVKPLTDFTFPISSGADLEEQYKLSLQKNGGKFFALDSPSFVNDLIRENFPKARQICSLVEGVKSTRIISSQDYPLALHDLDLAIVQGVIGVAENAAIWLPEEKLIVRVLPFITQHLIIVLRRQDIVATMHEAYARVNLSENAYGVFIAGPSKTADIEQSLVIGAHGARSLIVALIP